MGEALYSLHRCQWFCFPFEWHPSKSLQKKPKQNKRGLSGVGKRNYKWCVETWGSDKYGHCILIVGMIS
jgi:hypothetical protein